MRRINLCACLILLTAAICLSLSCQGNAAYEESPLARQLGFSKQNPLIIGLDADYPPLEYVNSNGTPAGYDVEFTTELMHRLGIPFTYHPNSWENIAPDVLHGKVDLGMMIYSPYRKDSTNYSRAVFRLYYQVVYPRTIGDERFDFRNLEGKRIAYMNSRPVGELLESEGAVKHSVTNLDQAFCELVDGKYDAVICYRYQAKYLIGLHQFTQLATDEISLPPREYCYVSHSKRLIEVIDHELLEMEQEGVTDDIYEIKSSFDKTIIPTWVWYLIVALAFVSLIVIIIVYHYRNREMRRAQEKAQESDRMKSAFIQNMTHQIRTPLNIVTGFAQVIHSEYQNISHDEMKMMVDNMMSSTNTITSIVDQLLELSIQQSRQHIDKNDYVGCNFLCREAVKGLTLQHPDKVKIDIETAVTDNLRIKTNKDCLMKILHELLVNSDKFTKEGSIVVGCEQTDDHTVCFSVSDTGPGVPEAERNHIFEQFVKLDDFTDGLGLGLTICRNTARLLGGDIRLDDKYTGGSRFLITMPL